MDKTAVTTSMTPEIRVSEYANFQQLFKRQRQRLKRKQLGIKPGSGYEMRGGVKRRMSPQRQMQLKRRGRRMARSASQQRAMWMGRQRAKSLQGVKPKFAGGKRLKSDVDFDGDIPALEEGERRFGGEHILQAVEQWMSGNTTEALRRLTIDPKFQLTPIATVADEIVRRMATEKVNQFIDVEIVEGEALAVYIEKGDGVDNSQAKSVLEDFGDVGLVAKPGEPMSDTQVAAYHVYMLKPSDKVLSQYEYTESVSEDDEPTTVQTPKSVQANPGHVGVNRPTMKTYGGVGTDRDVNPPKDDVAHLRPSDDDDPVMRRIKQKRAAKVARKSDLPLGIDPNLGQ